MQMDISFNICNNFLQLSSQEKNGITPNYCKELINLKEISIHSEVELYTWDHLIMDYLFMGIKWSKNTPF